jgi:hypothetical protein
MFMDRDRVKTRILPRLKYLKTNLSQDLGLKFHKSPLPLVQPLPVILELHHQPLLVMLEIGRQPMQVMLRTRK